MATSPEQSPPALLALINALKAVNLAGCWLKGERWLGLVEDRQAR